MEEQDLGALAAALTRRMIAEEAPILAAAGVSMWEYIVLVHLGSGPASSQSELARATRRDSTRLILHLDRLESAGLIVRAPSPADRRHNQICLTERGRSLLERIRQEIRTMESAVLRSIPPERAATLRADLASITRPQDDS